MSWMCGVGCTATCVGGCVVDTVSPVLDVISANLGIAGCYSME